MCSKGLSSIQHIDNPYRIKYPMKQVGTKGEGKWERISWDEALDTIADKMKDAIRDHGAAHHRHLAGHRAAATTATP